MKKNVFRKSLVIGIIMLFFGASVMPSMGNSIIMRHDSQGNKTTFKDTKSGGYIQDLIDNASDGDTIYIPSGKYYENIIIDKSISLIGEDKNTTIIDGTRSDSVIYIIKDGVTISGFTIQNGSRENYRRAGIEIYSLNNQIISNIITDNRVGIHPLWAGAMNCGGNNTFMNNIVIGNDKDAFCIHSSYNIIQLNNIENNSGGVFIYINAIGNRIEKNNFISNKICNAAFYKGYFTTWKNNYWDDWIGLKNPFFKIFPKAIIKYIPLLSDFIPTPLMNFDWHPVEEPYYIS